MSNTVPFESIEISSCKTFHRINGVPLYTARFKQVQKFHEPGLAPVSSIDGSFHINIQGEAAYQERFLATFGFYQNLSAVTAHDGWRHIRPDGTSLYATNYSWCGNFQNNACVVQDKDSNFFHIDLQGERLYQENYRYVGDFRDGVAVVQKNNGLYSHINLLGQLLHNRWFLDLDVFHKGYARARDNAGWFHIDNYGSPIYSPRYAMVEPFYNGFARVETRHGELLRIDGKGRVVDRLREALTTPFQMLSADIVGYWKTQTIKAAVDLNIFNYLPASIEDLSKKIGVNELNTRRLLRALAELRLVNKTKEFYELTELSEFLTEKHKKSLQGAVKHWANAHYLAWTQLAQALKENKPAYENLFDVPLFDWLDKDNDRLIEYQGAMTSYARHDYPEIIRQIDFSNCATIIDACGGEGTLLQEVLISQPTLEGILLERPNVVKNVVIPSALVNRMRVIGFDVFKPWPEKADIIVLSRVLHDWNDDECILILRNAMSSLTNNGRIMIVELLLSDESDNGGMLDMNMLVITGGRERSLQEYELLASKVGLRFYELKNYRNYNILVFNKIS